MSMIPKYFEAAGANLANEMAIHQSLLAVGEQCDYMQGSSDCDGELKCAKLTNFVMPDMSAMTKE